MPIDRVNDTIPPSAIPSESTRPVDPSDRGGGERRKDEEKPDIQKKVNPYTKTLNRKISRLEKPVYAREVMQTRVTTVDPDTPMLVVARKFIEDRVHHVAVVDQTHRLLGMVSETDLLVAFLHEETPENTLVSHIMDTKALTARPDTTLREVAKVLNAEGLYGIPVVDDDIKLLGLLTATELISTLDHSKLNVWI